MATKWENLPNAKHIDAVLAHAERYPEKWAADYDAAWDEARYVAYSAARDAARTSAYDAAPRAVYNAAWGAARLAVRGACSALVAWDDASQLLTLPVDTVRDMAQKGNHAAVLLLPAKLAMEEV